jgi:hypothetical protein
LDSNVVGVVRVRQLRLGTMSLQSPASQSQFVNAIARPAHV